MPKLILPLKKMFILGALLLSLNGCLYSNVRFPLDDDLWETKLGDKIGTSSNYSILWLVAWGDAGVKAAMENGGITKASQMDMGVKSFLFGAYIQRDTIVYGE